MGEFSSTLGFAVIVTLYVVIGLLAVAGSIVLSKKLFAPKFEQIFYGLFLIPIAGFYLAFVAYFGNEPAWRLEVYALFMFSLLGIIGTRIPFAIIFGYPLHGIWDALHEFHAHAGAIVFEPGQLTAIPLAYGIFCATYDVGIAVYFYHRRSEWLKGWQVKAA